MKSKINNKSNAPPPKPSAAGQYTQHKDNYEKHSSKAKDKDEMKKHANGQNDKRATKESSC